MSKLPAQPPVIRLRLQDASGALLKDTGYVFEWREVPGHHVVSQTNADGVLTEPILPGAKTALLSLADPGWTVVVAVSPFGAATTNEGLAARLENLNMLALAPSVPSSAADAKTLTRAVQRYKELKALAAEATLAEVSTLLAAVHDNK